MSELEKKAKTGTDIWQILERGAEKEPLPFYKSQAYEVANSLWIRLKDYEKERELQKQKLQQFFDLWDRCESWCEEQGEPNCDSQCPWKSKVTKLKEFLKP